MFVNSNFNAIVYCRFLGTCYQSFADTGPLKYETAVSSHNQTQIRYKGCFYVRNWDLISTLFMKRYTLTTSRSGQTSGYICEMLVSGIHWILIGGKSILEEKIKKMVLHIVRYSYLQKETLL